MGSHFYKKTGKRIFDLALTIPALLALLPLMAAVALLIRLKLGAPILFRQRRPGRHGEPFSIFKFRTMTDDHDEHGQPLPDASRLTRFGHSLRSTSLDELPELFNVLKGEMSVIGPRPLLMQYLPRYTSEQARRHEVKPGITGWAQVNGRNGIAWEEKFELDVWYADHLTLKLDLKILLLTLAKVMNRDGISAKDHATMLEFKGSLPEEK